MGDENRTILWTDPDHNALGLRTGETYSGSGTLGSNGGLSITSTYDSLFRRTSVFLASQSNATLNAYAYDDASRLTNVTDNTHSIGYSRVAYSPLIGTVNSKQNSDVRLTATLSYDYLNRLTSNISGSFQHIPTYNDANLRTRITLADGSYWVYQYDALGQVTSGKKYWADNSLVAGQQFEYTFDEIGNRTETKSGGDSAGSNLRTATYTNTLQNTYSSRTVPGYIDVFGTANTKNATVTVNTQATDRRNTSAMKSRPTTPAARCIPTSSPPPLWVSPERIPIASLFPPHRNSSFTMRMAICSATVISLINGTTRIASSKAKASPARRLPPNARTVQANQSTECARRISAGEASRLRTLLKTKESSSTSD